MRHALSVAFLFAVLGAAAPAAWAEWLVLAGGKRIETEGPWTLKGDLLTVHETSGRILTVGTSTVDTAACLKANGGSLRIEAISVAPPPGAPIVKPEIVSPTARPPRARRATGNAGSSASSGTPGNSGTLGTPGNPGTPGARSGSATDTAGAASGTAKPPATPGGGATAASSTAKPPATSGAGAGRSPAAAGTAAGTAASTAAKQSQQAQLQRELRYKQIVDGCARMFIVDRAGFQRCIDAQTKAPPAAAVQPPAQR
jgi:hypothetical protein